MITTTQYTIIPASLNSAQPEYPAHRAALLALWEQNLGFLFARRFEWLYESSSSNKAVTWLASTKDSTESYPQPSSPLAPSPHPLPGQGEGTPNQPPSPLAGEGRDEGTHKNTGGIVGCASLLKRDLYYRGLPFRAGVAVDLVVDEKHRVFGPVLPLIRTIAESTKAAGELDIIFAYPIKKAEMVFKRAGFKAVGSARLWVHLLRSGKQMGEIIKNRFLRRLVSWIYDTSMAIIDKALVLMHSDGSMYCEKREADDSFDDLWKFTKDRGVITSCKDRATLNWRYKENTSREYRFFCRYDADGSTLLGFVVFSIDSGICSVHDVFSQIPPADYKKLMSHFVSHIRRTEAAAIVLPYFGNPSFERILRSLFFIKRGVIRNCQIAICRPLDALLNTDVQSAAQWHLFNGDLDI